MMKDKLLKILALLVIRATPGGVKADGAVNLDRRKLEFLVKLFVGEGPVLVEGFADDFS